MSQSFRPEEHAVWTTCPTSISSTILVKDDGAHDSQPDVQSLRYHSMIELDESVEGREISIGVVSTSVSAALTTRTS